MLKSSDLRTMAEERLADARVLLAGGRHDTAVYVCGYALELALKGRICDTLDWDGYPETLGEFRDLSSFKVHNLVTLLLLSGRDKLLRQRAAKAWSEVKDWRPEMRYNLPGHVTGTAARVFLEAAAVLLPQI